MYDVGNFVEMKKPHACTIKSTGKKANRWEIIRVGADIKIRCTNCQHLVMLSRYEFERRLKKVLGHECLSTFFSFILIFQIYHL